ncbi:MAG: hypothetical protein IT366_19930 [Candidatus Hydrogenedentes bacterium]|nr:hypothetical protein [Candidatus Hydrogenedentota bacterium]
MPTPHDPKLPLRLAFSHKEKAEVAIRQCDRSLQSGGIDRDHHTKLRVQYDRELQVAKRTIERLLGIERARLETLETQRRASLEEQLHLGERVSAGKLSAQNANTANRRLTQRLAELNAQIEICRGRAETHTSEQVGGFIDLPFSEYATAEARSLNISPRVSLNGNVRMRDWYLTGAFAVIAAVSVFLPWFDTAGAISSLARPDSAVVSIAVQSGISAPLSQLAWILYAVLPFAGVLMTAGRKVWLLGWGYLTLGLLMLALAAYPSLAVGARDAAAPSIVGLASAFRMGAALYCASALGFLVLGAFRVSPAGDSLRHATTVSLALLGALAGVGLLAAFALIGVQGTAQVTFSAVLDESTRDRVAFEVNNEGRDPISCYFPLPADLSGLKSSAIESHTFGMHVSVRERNREAFSAVQVSPQVWRFTQGPLPSSGEMLVNPGTALKGTLDLRQLSSLGVEAASVRLQLLALDGALVNETEVELGERYLSTPGKIRDPLIIAPPPPRPVSGGEPTPQEASTPAASTLPQVESAFVEYVGAIGAQGVFRVYAKGGGSFTEVKAAVEGTVLTGWSVESFSRQPSGAVLLHKESGARVQVARGVVSELTASTQ